MNYINARIKTLSFTQNDRPMKQFKAGLIVCLLFAAFIVNAQTGPKAKNTKHVDRVKRTHVVVTKNHVWTNGPKAKKTRNWKTTNPEYKVIVVRKPKSTTKPRADKNATLRKGFWFI